MSSSGIESDIEMAIIELTVFSGMCSLHLDWIITLTLKWHEMKTKQTPTDGGST